MRILWLDINSSYSHSSLAFPSLHAQLHSSIDKQVEWSLISGTLKSSLIELLDQIERVNPDYILSTLWLFNHEMTLSLLAKYKAINEAVTIVLGGPEFLGDNRQFLLKNSFIDSVFKGEGEDIFPEFVKNILSNRDFKLLPGFCYIDVNGNYLDKGEYISASFPELKAPDSSRFFNWDKPFIQIETSRGCFNRCSFCVSGGKRRVEYLSPEQVRARITPAVKKGVREIRILDRTFNANPAHAMNMLSIFEEYHGKVQFHLEIHPAFLTAGIKEKLASLPVGLLHIEAGIQSLDDRVLETCGRLGGATPAMEGVRFLTSLNRFEVHTDLIAGLPNYSLDSLISDTIGLMEAGADEIQVELLKVLPGTSMREDAKRMGLRFSPLPPYEILQTPSISVVELKRASLISRIVDIFYNKSIWSSTFAALFQKDPLLFQPFVSFIEREDTVHHIGNERAGYMLYNFCEQYIPTLCKEVVVVWMLNALPENRIPGRYPPVRWIYGKSTVENPLFTGQERDTRYRYIVFENSVEWFAYNKGIDRCKAFAHFTQTL